tara:strand:- start:335 stop:673 length:339 start_codon:yes stop_codon:yes gene_type:complete
MSKFFTSEIVRQEVDEVVKLQEEIYYKLPNFSSLQKSDRIKIVDLLEQLLEKQKILYTRISLSDDPAAKDMKNTFDEQKEMLGIPKSVSAYQVFENMKTVITQYKKQIDRNP